MYLRRMLNTVNEDHVHAGDAMDALFEQFTDPGFVWDEPDPQDFRDFLKLFAKLIRAETKTGQGLVWQEMRAKAVEYIRATITPGMTHGFHHITPMMFGVQLALRVRRPSTIDQGDTCLCGAASVVYAFAKENPLGFTQFALELYLNGSGLFKTLVVQASPAILGNYLLRKNKIPWAVDYVTLVSLRQCSFFADVRGIKLLRPADETTMPGQLAEWLRQAGYDAVEDHTFFGKNQYKPVSMFAAVAKQPLHFGQHTGKADVNQDRLGLARTSLQNAIHDLRLGKLILMFGDGEIAEAMKNAESHTLQERQSPTGIGKHHWMTIRKLELGVQRVSLRAFTWGRTYDATFDMASFLSRYNGFISATP